MPVALLDQGHNVRIGSFADILLTVFDGPSNESTLEVMERATAAYAAAHPKFVSIVAIVAEKLESPTPQFRERSMKLHARFEDQMLCSATVITSKGMPAVMARTFLAAYQLVVHYKMPQQTFREVRKALEWISQHVPAVKQLDGLADALEAFCVRAT